MSRNPFDELEDILERMGRPSEWAGAIRTAPVDIEDRGDEFVLIADLPGFGADGIDLTVSEDVVSLSASHDDGDGSGDGGSEDAEPDDEGADDEHAEPSAPTRYVQRERNPRPVSRRLRLPDPVDEEGVAASYEDGVLRVRLPKEGPDEAEGHRIEID